MRNLRHLWEELRGSMWFVPSLIVLGAIALATGLIDADTHIDPHIWESWPRLFGAGAAGGTRHAGRRRQLDDYRGRRCRHGYHRGAVADLQIRQNAAANVAVLKRGLWAVGLLAGEVTAARRAALIR